MKRLVFCRKLFCCAYEIYRKINVAIRTYGEVYGLGKHAKRSAVFHFDTLSKPMKCLAGCGLFSFSDGHPSQVKIFYHQSETHTKKP